MEVVSGLGDGVFWVGLAAVLLDRHADAAGFALAAFARLGPRALVSAPAGVLADRVDRRRLLVTLDLARALLMLALAAAAAAGVELSILLAIVFVSYTAAAPYRPALTAALPQVAGESGLATANALLSTVRQLMTFLGPLAGAVVLRYWSPSHSRRRPPCRRGVGRSAGAERPPIGTTPPHSGPRSAAIVEGWTEMNAPAAPPGRLLICHGVARGVRCCCRPAPTAASTSAHPAAASSSEPSVSARWPCSRWPAGSREPSGRRWR
jgi:hypothetical protein